MSVPLDGGCCFRRCLSCRSQRQGLDLSVPFGPARRLESSVRRQRWQAVPNTAVEHEAGWLAEVMEMLRNRHR